MPQRIALGLDVSKLTVDVCLLGDGLKERAKFPNTPAGFKQMLSWLHGVDFSALHASLEPTGVYSRPLAAFLIDAGIAVSQVNSYSVQCHGRSKNFRSKTDRIDAYLLADYCLKENPPQWQAPSQTQSELKELQHRLVCLDEQIRQEENRLETVETRIVREDIKESLGGLYVRRKELEKAAKQLIKGDAKITANFEILNSIIGIGEKSSIRLLALVQFDKFESGRQTAAFAGLTPREFESGTSIHRKTQISRIGSSTLRSALYFPAMVAIQHNPHMRQFADNLRARNKPAKVIICAVMRKLLVLASALIRNQTFYDPNHPGLVQTI